MTVILIITFVILVILFGGSIYIISSTRNFDVEHGSAVLGGITVFLFFAACAVGAELFIPKTPNAIDVYRGNTTLQITYQDSVPVDTVVVFKNKN